MPKIKEVQQNFEGVVIKLLVKLVKIMEEIMTGQLEVEQAIQGLTVSIVALAGAIASQPKPEDLSTQVTEINSLKAQVDNLTAQLATVPPTP